MAIYRIPTYAEAAEIMDRAYLTPQAFIPIIFDLSENLDANNVYTRISRCQCCDLTIHQNLGEYVDECPRCREEELTTLVEALLIIQGSVVVYTSWRN